MINCRSIAEWTDMTTTPATTDDDPDSLQPQPTSVADALAEAEDDVQLRPLSIQAAALIRSMEALSNIFWISLGGTVLTIFFAGLNQLSVNANSDYIALGEYQIPKAILPLAALTFALFAFWMTANRLAMLAYVLETTRLPRRMVFEIFHLNPPVLHVFDRNNALRWSPFTGVAVLLLNWAVFIGNAVSLTWSVAVQEIATLASFDWQLMSVFSVLIVGVVAYGVRTVFPPLKSIFGRLHGIEMHIGWPRWLLSLVAHFIVILINAAPYLDIEDSPDDLIGPSIANAIDGETLLINGLEINLFGIDAMERDQVCQNMQGEDYACGRNAVMALQKIIEGHPVICLPLLNLNQSRVLGTCEVILPGEKAPTSPRDFIGDEYRPNSLSRLMVEQGYALTIGYGREIFAEEQRQAQVLRAGVWAGSFEPPAYYRSRPR
jgi:endonuclease YncB( thermonuclease family)